MIHALRGYVLPGVTLLTAGFFALGFVYPHWWYSLIVFVPMLSLGIHDVLQRRHNILRNYPILGHLRFVLEDAGPELHQYFVESNTEGRPFNRDQRSLIYERSKDVNDKKPFGSELDMYAPGYRWIEHSMFPKPVIENAAQNLRVEVGAGRCTKPYSASLFNISAMSFGALSPHAILALNTGAKLGGFAHNTGEGGLSRYHREPGGDIIWQIGTGYFGCRTDDGHFDPGLFKEQANMDQVKMIEIKISQGAKPGHGGVLPGAKVNEEIAKARKIPVGVDCVSPACHSAFDSPIELLEFVTQLRELSGGKPVGFKLCIGRVSEFLAICKAMLDTELAPDFITIDGAEGGTGAAPREFSDHLGVPFRESLLFAHNALVGCGLRDQVRIATSGKRLSAFEIAVALAMGADWCNAARPFMLSLECIQAQQCHTNKCPVGVATQNPSLFRALTVDDKAKRVAHFHKHSMESLAEFTAAAGLTHPRDFSPEYIWERINPTEARSLDQLYDFLEPRQLLDGRGKELLQNSWAGVNVEMTD